MQINASVIVVIAHPDDELFVSGTLCLLNERGYATHLICVTGGRGLLSNNAELQRNYEVRGLELKLSAQTLGVNAVHMLSHPDETVEDWREATPSWDLQALDSELSTVITTLEPCLILTHGPLGGYGHPAHKQVFRSVTKAADRIGYRNAIYSFCGRVGKFDTHWRYFDQPSDVIVNVRKYLDRPCSNP